MNLIQDTSVSLQLTKDSLDELRPLCDLLEDAAYSAGIEIARPLGTEVRELESVLQYSVDKYSQDEEGEPCVQRLVKAFALRELWQLERNRVTLGRDLDRLRNLARINIEEFYGAYKPAIEIIGS